MSRWWTRGPAGLARVYWNRCVGCFAARFGQCASQCAGKREDFCDSLCDSLRSRPLARNRFIHTRQTGALIPVLLTSILAASLSAFLVVSLYFHWQPLPGASTSPGFVESDDTTESGQSVQAEAASTPQNLASLYEEATLERAQLAAEVLRLDRQLVEVQGKLDQVQSELADIRALQTDDSASEESIEQAQSSDNTAEQRTRQDRRREAYHANLQAAGLDAVSAREFQRRRDLIQLERLELVDLANREGWADSERFEQQLAALEAREPDLRSELGEDAYDRYLQAAGRANRVVIESVIPGSAADLAGLMPGDIIQRYDDSTIFATREMQQATRQGSREDIVSLSFERAGELLDTQLSRGPLGVSLRPMRYTR